jgi:hypothetical protein
MKKKSLEITAQSVKDRCPKSFTGMLQGSHIPPHPAPRQPGIEPRASDMPGKGSITERPNPLTPPSLDKL